MTLVEVMVGATLLSLLGLALLTMFVQNLRMSKVQSFRSQAVTASLTVLEELRFLQYPEIEAIYNNSASGSFQIQLPDPAATSGYAALTLPVNVRDGVAVSGATAWTTTSLVVDPSTTAPRLPMRFFLLLSRNRQTTGTVVDVFEVVLLYQWAVAGQGTSRWQTGNVRLIVPNLNPL